MQTTDIRYCNTLSLALAQRIIQSTSSTQYKLQKLMQSMEKSPRSVMDNNITFFAQNTIHSVEAEALVNIITTLQYNHYNH